MLSKYFGLQVIYHHSFDCFNLFVLFHDQYDQSREKKPRESLLRAEFANAIDFINKDLPEEKRLKFLHWDIQKHTRRYVVAFISLCFLCYPSVAYLLS